MPEISVICTVKNGGQVLKETVESILAQTYSDWEFIIVDDGSTDDSLKILTDIAAKDSRIKIVNTPGIGRAKALNLAIKQSQGKYIANIDADDPSHPQRLAIQKLIFDRNQEISLLATDTFILKNIDKINWEVLNIEFERIHLQNVTNRLVYGNPIAHSSVMILREAMEVAGCYNENRVSQFDYDLWFRLAAKGYKLFKVSLPLASKRIHTAQWFENKSRLKYLKGSLEIQVRAIKKFDNNYKAWFSLVGRFIWGLLPQNIRITVRKWLATDNRQEL